MSCHQPRKGVLLTQGDPGPLYSAHHKGSLPCTAHMAQSSSTAAAPHPARRKPSLKPQKGQSSPHSCQTAVPARAPNSSRPSVCKQQGCRYRCTGFGPVPHVHAHTTDTSRPSQAMMTHAASQMTQSVRQGGCFYETVANTLTRWRVGVSLCCCTLHTNGHNQARRQVHRGCAAVPDGSDVQRKGRETSAQHACHTRHIKQHTCPALHQCRETAAA
jgi:hypothetical protein